jgi:hypothetical protein
MPKDILHDRERAEEAAYFQSQDAKLIQKLRERAQLSEIAQALGEKLRVDNPDLLKRIMDLGITKDTGAAFVLAPLVQVAWIDNHVSRAEYDTVLRLALERGVGPGSADLAQLLQWLQVRPSDALFEASREAIRVGLSVLPHAEAEQRINGIVEACEAVAEASGGLAKLLHLHSGISPEEQSVLDQFRALLVSDPPRP